MSGTDLSPVMLLQQEIQTLTSAMRRNQRWASTSTSSYQSSSAPLPPAFRPNGTKRSRGDSSVSRRGRASGEGVEEGDLMLGFVELRRTIGPVKDIHEITPLVILNPFLALVRSPLTSGPITSLALAALHSIVVNILPLFLSPVQLDVRPSTPIQIALAHLTSALSQCRFPSSSPQQDELVLLRLLRVIDSILLPLPMPTSSSYGSMLDQMADESVCELLEVGLGMLARARLGEGLRTAAQSCVQGIVRACFARLKTLTKDDVDRLLASVKKSGNVTEPTVNLDSSKAAAVEQENTNQVRDEEKENSQDKTELATATTTTEAEKKSSLESQISVTDEEQGPPSFTPHSLPTILELLRVLIALLNPSDQAHTDSMRLCALAILNTALEVGGVTLGKWPELREGLRDEGCRYLFQLTRSDSPALLSSSLRTTSTLFATLLPHLKLQLELFLSYVIERLTPSHPTPIPPHLQHISRPGTPVLDNDSGKMPNADPSASSTPRPLSLLPPVPNETRELMLETLAQVASKPSFMVDCWVNFDCSTENEDMFERLIAFLIRGVYPPGPPRADGSTNLFDGLENAQLISLEILLSFVAAMSERLEDGDETWPESAPSAESLKTRKDRKGVLLIGAALFNAKPKQGLAMLEKEGVIIPDDGPGTDEEKRTMGIAKFLRHSTRLDKKLLGEYISRPDQVDLLKAFMGLFNFEGKSVADAMRELLETFRLPGEAHPIARITEIFSSHFFSYRPAEIATEDAVYVLAYSVIMLNTDLHNPQNRKRMTIDDYKRNLRGVNDGADFPPEYLAGIHESLKRREIILPEEHGGQSGFDYAWKTLMMKSRGAGQMVICNTSIFDEAMFKHAWRPLIGSIAYAFTTSAQDEHVIQKAITGFRQCASLAGHFNIPEVFDTIVLSLSTATGLGDEGEHGYQTANYPVVDKENQSVTVSPLSIKFGHDYRSQIATVVLFTIANGHGNAIREGWTQIFEMFQTLFLHSLLPAPMLQMEDFLAGTTMIPMKAAAPAAAPERRPEGGLLSTLSSYLLSPYGNGTEGVVMETSDADVESTLVAVDCLGSCKLEELYGEILSLEVDALLPAILAIRSLAEARTTNKLQVTILTREGVTQTERFEGQLPYDPACVFHLEMMVSLASRGKQHIGETWPIIFEYISTLLNSAQSFSVLLIERAVVGLLRLCLIVSETPELRDQLYIALDVLRSLPSSVLNAVSEQLMAGVAKILEKDSTVVKSQTEWGLIIALFRATVAHPEASKLTLAIVQKMSSGATPPGGPGLSGDNYAGVVALLDEFATAAGAAVLGRQQKRAQQPTLGPTVEKGLAALDSLYDLRNVIPGLTKSSNMGDQEAWNTFWQPPLLALSKQCMNANPPIRQRAITYLQRLLLSTQLSLAQSTQPIFDRVLFPIMDELLKSPDPALAETRLRTAGLLCKVFLADATRLAESPEGVVPIFTRLLTIMERMVRSEKDGMNEAGESLKNVLLVLSSAQLLVSPPTSGDDGRTPQQVDLWGKSHARIGRILPGFLEDFVAQQPQPAAPAPASTQMTAEIPKEVEAKEEALKA